MKTSEKLVGQAFLPVKEFEFNLFGLNSPPLAASFPHAFSGNL